MGGARVNRPEDLEAGEAARIVSENRRRESEIDQALYAPWQPAELFMRQGRERVAAHLLRRAGAFPARGDRCLEVGHGRVGWLATLQAWGLETEDLYGIELDPVRSEVAGAAFPGAHLEVGDARSLPWEDGIFQLAIVSTVLTSILSPPARVRVAQEITRVLQPGGSALVYDFRWNNPSNPNVRRIGRGEIAELFPGFRGKIRSVTLMPPLARALAPRSWTLATLLEGLPFLRSHLVAVMVNPGIATDGQPAHA
jgi:SAM-dependent methyltransferase